MKSLIVGDEVTVHRLAERLKTASSHAQYQRIQCVLLRATLGSSAAEIAQLLGWSTATVHVMHSRWAKEGEAMFDVRPRGGRHHQHLTLEQEAQLLAPFVARAQVGARCCQWPRSSRPARSAPARRWRALPSIGCCSATAGTKSCRAPDTRRRTLRRRAPLKKLRRAVRQEVYRQAEQGRRVRLMFQDEGRFGLLGTPRRCWAPRGMRPVVGARLQRQYLYAFSAVSPHDGVLDSLVLPWVNAQMMSLFLAEVARRHAQEFVLMVMLAHRWGTAGALEHAADVPAALQPGTQPNRAPVESTARRLLRQPCVRGPRRCRSCAHRRYLLTRSRQHPSPINDRIQVDNVYIFEGDLV